MHNFSGTTFVHNGSVLFTMRRRALHNSQHRLLCGTNIAHNSALRERFQRYEECNESEQRRCTWALTTRSHSLSSPVQYDTDTFFFSRK